MKKTVIFLNAGHGGMNEKGESMTDPEDGKMTLHTNGKEYHHKGWFYEGVFNRQIADEFAEKAQLLGFEIVKVYHPLYDGHQMNRVRYANSLAPQINVKGKQCIWLSFHANAAGSGTAPKHSAEGVCTFVFKRGTETAKAAEQITKAMQDVFDAYGSKRRATLIHDKPLDETFHTAMPAMLFEVGFFDNPRNADLLIDPCFRSTLVDRMLKEIDQIYK